MPALWHFQSFSRRGLDAVLARNDDDTFARLAAAVDDTGQHGPQTNQMIQHLLANGPDYAGLSNTQARELDAVICALFGPLGLEEPLELEFESPEGVSPKVIELMINRGAGEIPLRILPTLKQGRRIGQNRSIECDYCVLSMDELGELQEEVAEIMKLHIPWPQRHLPLQIQENLQSVFANIEAKGKDCVGLLG